MLSGHTHAGQITVARLHELALGHLVGHRYVHGLYGNRRRQELQEHAGAVYVGAGLGAAVMPFRIGARAQPEITIFELGQAPGSFLEDHEEQDALRGREVSERTQFKRMLAETDGDLLEHLSCATHRLLLAHIANITATF